MSEDKVFEIYKFFRGEDPNVPEYEDLRPATVNILKFFEYGHLPDVLQVRSKPFCELACRLAATTKESAELTVALRKLLESKDAAVRAAL